MGLLISEVYINATKNVRFGESPVFESFTDDAGKLFKALQKEYGRCTSKVYVDTKEGTKTIGWVFQGRQRYEDSKEIYLREVWVTRHER